MPKDNIEKAILRGMEKGSESMEKVIYEAYGPKGSALIIIVLTDNRNRSAAEIRHALSKCNVSLATPGSSMWMFEEKNGEYNAKETISLCDEDREKIHTILKTLNEIDDINAIITNTDI